MLAVSLSSRWGEKLITAHCNQETVRPKGRGRPKAQSAPTKLDPGKPDTGASTQGPRQLLAWAFYTATAGIKEVILVDWSAAQDLLMNEKGSWDWWPCRITGAKVTELRLSSLLILDFVFCGMYSSPRSIMKSLKLKMFQALDATPPLYFHLLGCPRCLL